MKKRKLIEFIASCGYIGYIPIASGTVASFAGLLLYICLSDYFAVYLGVLFFLVILGLLITPDAEDIFGIKDSPKIVIDELAAILIVFFRIPPTFTLLAVGFIIFRILDILKPYPANRIENSHLRISVMGDDIIVAVYTNIILQILKLVV